MKYLITCLFVFAIGLNQAQNNGIKIPQAKAEDVQSIDAIISTLYETISGKAGETRDWNRFKSLWHPEGRFIMVTPTDDGHSRQIIMDSEQFIALSKSHSKNNSFYEIELVKEIDQIGHIAQVVSSYVIKKDPADKDYSIRGVNLFQLYNDGERWWILSCLWENEMAGMKIPKEYLK